MASGTLTFPALGLFLAQFCKLSELEIILSVALIISAPAAIMALK